MKFRNYCLVVMGDIENVLIEIEKISESKPNLLNAKGIMIATFTSVSTPKELNEWFRLNKRSFLIFDLNPENSGFNITKKEIHEGLFGFLKLINLEDKSEELLREIKIGNKEPNDIEDAKVIETPIKKVKKITEKDVQNMTNSEKENLWNKLVDAGVQNLTEDDKTLLQILSR